MSGWLAIAERLGACRLPVAVCVPEVSQPLGRESFLLHLLSLLSNI